jgi:hypothetical protein
MLETGDLLVVRLFEQAYLRKPPGMPWAIALSTLTFGPGEFASRFVSAVAIAIGALASLLFIQRWFGKPFGLIAGLAFVLAPAQGGHHEDGRGTWGHSMIVDPWGAVVAQLDHDEPGVLVADLDLDRVAEARAKIPAWRGGRSFEGPVG